MQDVDPDRIAGYGLSLGGEVFLEHATRSRALVAVVSDEGSRATDLIELDRAGGVGASATSTGLGLAAIRALSGEETSQALVKSIHRAEAPLLLIAAGRGNEPVANEEYRERAGGDATVYAIPEAGHTRGLKTRPDEYEARVIAFLDRAVAP